MPPKNIIRRSPSHIKEDQSKRNFEDVIQPWYVLDWSRKDYGIDTIVEITTRMQSGEYIRPESKYFFVQLKATDKLRTTGDYIRFSLAVKNIIAWAASNIPVLFVLNHLPDNQFYFLWMNEELITSLETSNRYWDQQTSVTLKIPKCNQFCNGFHETLRGYIIDYKKPSRKHIEVGHFFSLQNQCFDLVNEFEDIVDPFAFSSIKSSINKFKEDIDKSIYRVAITGLSRVGKSSLVNTLLKRNICPVGFFQTTSVPIQIIPDKEEYIQIYFQDDTTLKRPYSFDCINEFASQEHNEDNHKKVRIVSISILDQSLQRGISVYDIPGLNDPDDYISTYSWSVASKANAIFYVIDITPAQNGGFIFQKDYKQHISDLGQSLDKVFIIFNKTDSLSPDILKMLKERVINDLKKLNLYEKVSDKMYYITTIFENERSDFDSIKKLEEDLWNFIINENKYGLYRLALIIQEIQKSTNDFTDLLSVRVLEHGKREKLEEIIKSIYSKIPQLQKDFNLRIKEFKNYLSNYLENRKGKILIDLEKWLKSIPVATDFPSNVAIKQFLKIELNKVLQDANKEYIGFIIKQKDFIDQWIESHLRQLREMLSANASKKLFDFKDVEEFETPKADLSSAFGMGILAFLVTAALAPPMAIGAAIITFFSSLIMSSESIRVKKISKTLEKSRDIYDKSFQTLISTYFELIVEQSAHIETYAEKKLSLFFEDISTQMEKLQNPMSDQEKSSYELAFEKIRAIQRKMQLAEIELLSYRA